MTPVLVGSVSGAPVGAVVLACAVGAGLAGVRWLRVAQREHYLAGSVTRFAWRWWSTPGFNRLLVMVAVFGLLVSPSLGMGGLVVAVIVAIGPFGLGLRGRTSALKWTRRLATVAVLGGILEVGALVGAYLSGQGAWLAALLAVAVPSVLDVALAVLGPVEDRLARHFVDEATTKLARIAPVVVAITGSYGKTTTKGYVAHLLNPSRAVVASPASFNNRAGLAKAVNENLVLGTEVFIAEMGTYGRGEIAALCRWIPPTIAVITAIGPVHLERFGTEDEIVTAKSEITVEAQVVVLNIDDDRLARLVPGLLAQHKKVWACSIQDSGADVHLESMGNGTWRVFMGQVLVATVPIGAAGPTNVACALAVAAELGVDTAQLAHLLPSLPVAGNRLSPSVGAGGFAILDDTYNSNPAGCRAALARLANSGTEGGRRVVVTPGMVELGRRQFEENRLFAANAAKVADYVVIVGRTNRAALMAGANGPDPAGSAGPPTVDLSPPTSPPPSSTVPRGTWSEKLFAINRAEQQSRHEVPEAPDAPEAPYAPEVPEAPENPRAVRSPAGAPGRGAATVVVVGDREEAVEWVRGHLGPGDTVLYENDLPDHFP
ncbi:MAG: Mur ligase family protein [Acidimicrobiales bacterium]